MRRTICILLIGILFTLSVTVQGTFIPYTESTFGEKVTILIQSPPDLTNEYPTNGSTDISINPRLRIYASDSDLIDLTFRTNASGSWQNIGSNNTVPTGYYYQDTSNMNQVGIKYWWSVNATDPAGSGDWTNETYHFTTYDNFVAYTSSSFGLRAFVESVEPQISNEQPINNSMESDMYSGLSVDVIDYQGIFDIIWKMNTSSSWVTFAYNSSCNDGTYRQTADWANESNTMYWWSVHVNDTEGHWTNETYCFKTANYSWSDWSDWWVFYYAGRPPTLSGENPINNSNDVLLTTATVNVTITDADGDPFNWSIEGNKIITNSGIGDTNGSKAATLSNLQYNNIITWYVNVTDGINTINESYTFSTPVNNSPVHSEIIPGNGATGVALDIGLLSFKTTDSEGDLMNYSVTTSPSIGTGSGNDKSNGTYTVPISSLSYSTTYYWTLKVTDGISWNNQTYEFTTLSSSQNPPNTPTNPSPSDGATNRSVDLGSLLCSVSDPDGDVLNVTFKWGNGTLIGYDYPVSSGGRAEINIDILNFNTTYEWFTIANDTGDSTQSPVWNFTTGLTVVTIALDPTSYNFSIVAFDSSKESAALTINNTGEATITKIEFKVSDMQDINSFMSWSIDTVPSVDRYAMKYYTDAKGTWNALTDSYIDIGETIDIENETSFKLKIFTPILSTFKKKMYGTLTIQYTGGTTRKTDFGFSLIPAFASNQTMTEMNLTNNDFIKGGLINSDLFYISISNNMTVNTTINSPDTYTGKSWGFWTAKYTLTSKKVYGITFSWDFVVIPTKGSLKSFRMNVDAFDDYLAFVIAPNPGYFQNNEWWFNLLNDARDLFIKGEMLQ